MISVVVPAFNEEHYLDDCLSCLFSQTRLPGEIIVVDNNSTDATCAIAKKYPVRLIQEEMQGISYARNAGFNAAKHDIIARTDADARPPSNWIEQILDNFETQKIDALSGPICFYDSPLHKPSTKLTCAFMNTVKIFQKGKEIMIGSNLALTSTLWKQVELMLIMDNSKVHEDIDLALRIQQVGGCIHRDDNLVMPVSARRAKKPISMLVEYPYRLAKTCVYSNDVPEKLKRKVEHMSRHTKKYRR